MEEVDKILIHSLRQAGTAVPPEVQSVRDLSPELVVEAAVRCLRAVRPSLGAPLSPLLPPGISARFRLASELAAACQELGFGGDVGYQTFLYSSEHDTRRLLLFLVEKLPRDEGERGAEPPGKSGALLRAVGARIREHLGTPWVPPQCRTPKLQRLHPRWGWGGFPAHPPAVPPELQEYFGGCSPPGAGSAPPFLAEPPGPAGEPRGPAERPPPLGGGVGGSPPAPPGETPTGGGAPGAEAAPGAAPGSGVAAPGVPPPPPGTPPGAPPGPCLAPGGFWGWGRRGGPAQGVPVHPQPAPDPPA
ncbi:unnamed protein product, partial [Coccothraustes coccothraustes]